MRYFATGLTAGAMVGLLAVIGLARAEDVPLDKVPANIMKVVKKRHPAAELTKVTKEVENNVVLFDVELKEKGRKYEMDIREDGTVIDVEKEIDLKDLPAIVAKAVEDKYPKSTIVEIMEISKVNGAEETRDHYEVVLTTADKKKVEVEVGLDGKIRKEESSEAKK